MHNIHTTIREFRWRQFSLMPPIVPMYGCLLSSRQRGEDPDARQ